jgi:hypothetical protein
MLIISVNTHVAAYKLQTGDYELMKRLCSRDSIGGSSAQSCCSTLQGLPRLQAWLLRIRPREREKERVVCASLRGGTCTHHAIVTAGDGGLCWPTKRGLKETTQSMRASFRERNEHVLYTPYRYRERCSW